MVFNPISIVHNYYGKPILHNICKCVTDAVCSAMQSIIMRWVNFFLSLFIAFRTNVWMSIIPSPCSFFFALHLEWCINLITNKKSNEICIFANICIFLLYLVCGSNFLQLSSTFCRNAQKKKRAKANREKFKCR